MRAEWLPAWFNDRLKHANPRLVAALSGYFVLAAIAAIVLDGFTRTLLLFFFALLAIKTIRHSKDEDADSDRGP